jgi:hypothetical protein
MNRRFSFVLVFSVLFVLVAITQIAQPANAQQPGCTDPATGRPVTCTPTPPTPVNNDRDFDSVPDDRDNCPDQGGDVNNGGCPFPAGGTEPNITPTAIVDEPRFNPVRPDPTGPCQLSTAGLTAINVRSGPGITFDLLGVLDPAQLYDVLGAVVSDGEIWYRVDMGWVLSAIVVVDGNCPVREVQVRTDVYTLDLSMFSRDVASGLYPDSKCIRLPFDLVPLCYITLEAVARPGGTETPQDLDPGDVVVCGVMYCTVVNLAVPQEYDPCAVPEFCEPPPPPPSPFDDEEEGAPLCENVLGDFATNSSEPGNPFYVQYQPGGYEVGAYFTSGQPPIPPEPCRVNLFVLRNEESIDGVAPVNVVQFELTFPPAEPRLPLMEYHGLMGEEGAVGYFDTVRTDLRGNVCITFTHGDFSICPGQAQPTPEATPEQHPAHDEALFDLLFAEEDGDDPTEYSCKQLNGTFWGCKCSGDDDCLDMFANACNQGDELIHCGKDGCACGFDIEPE